MKIPNFGGGRWAIATALVILPVLFAPTAPTLAAQNVGSKSHALPKIVISPLDTPSGDTVAESIARAVSQSLILMLDLTRAFTIEHADFLDPVASYHRSVLYYQQVGARIGIFGSVKPVSSGAYKVAVDYWRASAPDAPPKEFTVSLTNFLTVFAAADKLAVDVASSAAGRKLTVGTIVVENAAKLKKYSIYADGVLVARNRSQVQMLTGKRTIIVAVPGPLGDKPVQTFHVDVKTGKTVALTLSESAITGKTPGGQAGSAPKGTEAKRPQPTTGTLKVTSTPDGATVLLDGNRVGTTPLSLESVSVGTHDLRLARQFFKAGHLTVNIRPGETSAVDVQLSLNENDPALKKRMLNPRGASVSSILWTTAQLASTLSISAISTPIPSTLLTTAPSSPTSTSSFWAARPFYQGAVTFNQMLFIDTSLITTRIGNRLAGNSVLTGIGDAGALAAAALITIDSYPIWSNSTAAQSGNVGLLTSGTLMAVGGITLAVDVIYDAISARFAADHANAALLQYVTTHGTLPPLNIRQPHRFIVATGGESVLRAGYHLPIVPSYLSFEATGGVGAGSLGTSGIDVSANAALSYNPWGPKTGNLRPELFVGLRASTTFASTTIAPEIGTGNDWIGRNFDIFTRGGIDYDLINHHWDQFFTMGTRIF